ncbi:MAG TPA: hypothetical protein HPP54_01260 [Nitrospinae bacterium]|nr:hypothetical protein [Nitrospinota bacterium]
MATVEKAAAATVQEFIEDLDRTAIEPETILPKLKIQSVETPQVTEAEKTPIA